MRRKFRAWIFWSILLAAPAAVCQSLESLLQRAVSAQKAGDTETAIRLYREVLRQRPDLSEVRSNLGAALAREGRFAEAIQEYAQALKADPGNPAITLNLALARYKLGEYKEAAEFLAPVLPRQPDNLQMTLLMAACLTQMGESAKVVELLSPIERAQPDNPAVAYLLGTALLHEKEQARAQILLDRILRNGESAEAQLLLGASKLGANEYTAAIENLRRAEELNPNLPEVHAYYGKALRAAGNTPAAAEQFRAELAQNPYDFTSNLELAVLSKQEGRLDEALACLGIALRVRPNDPAALYQRATIDVLKGNNEQARRQLEQIVRAYPGFLEAQVSLATVYYRLNRKEDGDRVRQIVRKLQQEQQVRQAAEAQKQ